MTGLKAWHDQGPRNRAAGIATVDATGRILSYEVVEGDALEVIAARFGLRTAADFLMHASSSRRDDGDLTHPVYLGETFPGAKPD